MTNESHLFQYMSFCSAQVSFEVMIFLLERNRRKKKKKQGKHENLLIFLEEKKIILNANTHELLKLKPIQQRHYTWWLPKRRGEK